MSPDLTRSLHDAVDTGPDDSPFDLATLTGRIRRRRTVRAGVRSGVAVGAVGAVALGAVYVGGRQPHSVLPAARTDAAPGTCGSDIGLIPTADPGAVGLMGPPDLYTDLSVTIPAPGTSLGRYLGRTLDPLLLRDMPPEARAAAFAAAVSEATEALADAEARRESETSGGAALSPGEVAALDRAVEAAHQRLEEAEVSPVISSRDGTMTLDGLDDPGTALLVTHGSTVVAADPAPLTGRSSWLASVEQSSVMSDVDTELRTCASPGDPGDVPLPAGEYGVYVSYEEAGDRVVAGPWPLTLVTASSPDEALLPAGFPVDAVPLVGGRLLAANPASGGGWQVEIAVDGDDAVSEAVRLLGGDAETASTAGFLHEGHVVVPGWDVRVASSTSDDDEPTVGYTIRPS
jgi:hypothetical protein